MRNGFIPCRACGHYGHRPGPRCPLRNLVPDERRMERERRELAHIFPHNPQLVALLEQMHATWKPAY